MANMNQVEFSIRSFSTICEALDEKGYMVYVDSTVGSRARIFTSAPETEIDEMLQKYNIEKLPYKPKVIN